MLSDEKKLQICEDIINSDVFSKAPKSSSLLRYLVKSTVAGNYLKEDIIDLEFFGENPNTNKTSPRIRVNVYNLRKKLEKYYLTEGRNSIWKICIDKGQYSVRFENQNIEKIKFSNINAKQILPYAFLAIVCIIFAVISIKPESPILWTSFFDNKKSNTLIIADFFGIQGQTITGDHGWTRDYTINSARDYYKYIDKNPQLKETTKPADYHYITSMGALATHNISELFFKNDSHFDIRFTSNTSIIDLKKGNLIFVGPHSNKNKFISLFNDSNPYFEIDGSRLYFDNHPTLPSKTFTTHYKSVDRDFSIVSRFKGPDNNDCFIFFSNHDIGVKATVEHFTNKDSLEVFKNKYMNNKQNFTSIYEVYGKERTNLGLKNILTVPF
ncbi:hypothetical protein [uncultured Algibacter sp.]|uniref:hypothetical protein n=1 Tax=uncultured Algibacter sp. TaxID=298659 RepID=UPI003216DB6E